MLIVDVVHRNFHSLPSLSIWDFFHRHRTVFERVIKRTNAFTFTFYNSVVVYEFDCPPVRHFASINERIEVSLNKQTYSYFMENFMQNTNATEKNIPIFLG